MLLFPGTMVFSLIFTSQLYPVLALLYVDNYKMVTLLSLNMSFFLEYMGNKLLLAAFDRTETIAIVNKIIGV